MQIQTAYMRFKIGQWWLVTMISWCTCSNLTSILIACMTWYFCDWHWLSCILADLATMLQGLPEANWICPNTSKMYCQRSLVHLKATASGNWTSPNAPSCIPVQQLPPTPRGFHVIVIHLPDVVTRLFWYREWSKFLKCCMSWTPSLLEGMVILNTSVNILEDIFAVVLSIKYCQCHCSCWITRKCHIIMLLDNAKL